MKVYFEEVQNAVNNFAGKIEQVTDPETKEKYTQGVIRYLEGVLTIFKGSDDA